MIWSPQQDKSLVLVDSWFRNAERPFYMLGGYAGTGKTTLARHFASSVKGEVYFAAYTGKAAHVLRKAGCPNVSTIHGLIYLPKNKCQQKLKDLEAELLILGSQTPQPIEALMKLRTAIDEEKTNLARPSWTLNLDSPLNDASLLIVDEYSMIDQQMGEDLASFGVPILALGDPGQLPPIKGDGFFNRDPDFMLTEIHRQARDNPIIWLSQEVRQGRSLRPGSYGTSRVASLASLPQEDLRSRVLGTDQLLVGRNTTRMSSNRRARELLGRGTLLPEVGDKLICLRNNHKLGLLNGQMWTVAAEPISEEDELLVLDLKNDEGGRQTVLSHPHHFLGTSDKLDFWTRLNAEEFDYGYAVTVHKAQGSQWGNVLLFDEWFMKDRQRWLYTGITRASESIDIVQF